WNGRRRTALQRRFAPCVAHVAPWPGPSGGWAGPGSTPPGSGGTSRLEPDRLALTADEGSHVAIADEGALVIDHGLYILADVLDDFRPGTGGLMLVEAGPAGHEVGG